MDQDNEPQPLSDESCLSFEITAIENGCENNDTCLNSEAICQAREELEKWQMDILKLEKENSDLICRKLDAEDERKRATNQLCKLNSEWDNYKDEFLKEVKSCQEMLREKKSKIYQTKRSSS